MPIHCCRLITLFVALLSVSLPCFAELDASQRLSLTARVWGLAKYRHPAVTNCQQDWNQALIALLPGVEAARSDAELDARIGELLTRAGNINARTPGPDTPAWIVSAPLSNSTKNTLAAIAAQRPSRQCYVSALAQGNADFTKDAALSGETDSNTRTGRLLATFRYWNAIEYFFGYKDLIGRDWALVLEQYVLPLANAEQPQEFATLLRLFTSEINDSHGYMAGLYQFSSFAPLRAVYTGGAVVVENPGATLTQAGDVITSIDGVAVAKAVRRASVQAHGSNAAWRYQYALRVALNQAFDKLTVLRDGVAIEIAATRGNFSYPRNPGFQEFPAGGTRSCSVAVIDAENYASSQLSAVQTALRRVNLLVVDLRGYASNAYFTDVSSSRMPAQTGKIAYASPDLKNPGAYIEASLGSIRSASFAGKVVVIVNHNSISRSEFLAMLHQGRANTIVIGNQTAGADGELGLNLNLPGRFNPRFSSNRISYIDGPSQRNGVRIDVQVAQTPTGLRQGRDELMEAATDCRWVSETPKSRTPRTGLYSVSTRSGEGLAIFAGATSYRAVSYSYDAEGISTLQRSNATLTNGKWDAPLLETRANTASISAGTLQLDFQNGPYAPACELADQARLDSRASIAWPMQQPNSQRCIEPFFFADQSSSNDIWRSAEPADASKWELLVQRSGNVAVVYLHAFDASGVERWMIGSGTSEGVSELKLNMLRIRGACQSCPSSALTREAAGTISLTLNDTPSASIDVQFHDGSRLRTSMGRLVRTSD